VTAVRIAPFAIERYFARYEFDLPHLLSSSDCEALTLAETLAIADPECRDLWDGLTLGYTESPGLGLLREEIARMYETVAPEQVIEVVPEEGIFLAMQALLEPGDEVVAAFPAYQSLYAVAESIGCEMTRWEPTEADTWRFELEDLRRLVGPATKLIVINAPHNPTGFLPTSEELAAIVDVARDAGAWLFADEMYRYLERDPSCRLPAAVDVYERAVSLSGMSKAFSMPGVRVGWLATRDGALMSRLAELKDYTTICGSAPSEVLALIGLRNRDEIAARNLAIIGDDLAAIEELAARRADILRWTSPVAGSVGLLRLDVPEGVTVLCERAAAEAGVMLLPSTVFAYGDSHVRLGFGREAFAEGLAVFAEWLDDTHPMDARARPSSNGVMR
jgi:aspartate/methionine/tyrosine aminotransferase